MRIAVLIPCYNEAATIQGVVREAGRVLPGAVIFVGDNNSTDDTANLAQTAGARIIRESRQGKGFMVRRMFREVEADWYVLLDGDATYDLASAPGMIDLAQQNRIDFVNGVRAPKNAQAFRAGHALGNRLLTGAVARLFGHGIEDMLSGYKVLSRRFVKSFPALSTGFDLETDLAVHTLECGLPMQCMRTPYGERPPGSHSKLSTFKDGLHIGRVILALVRYERPMIFFGVIAALLCALAAILALPVLLDYLHSGLVQRFPTAILSMVLLLGAGGALLAGVIGDAITRGRREVRMLFVLMQPASPAVGPVLSTARYPARRGP